MAMPTLVIIAHSISEDHCSVADSVFDTYPIQHKINEYMQKTVGCGFIPNESQGDEWYGGSLTPSTHLLVGYFNHFRDDAINALWKYLGELEWYDRESVQMLVRSMDKDEKFRVFNLDEPADLTKSPKSARIDQI
jgi:hypothetical protein